MCVCVETRVAKFYGMNSFNGATSAKKMYFSSASRIRALHRGEGRAKLARGRGTRETAREFVANFLGISADCANAPGSLIHRRCWSFSTFYIFADSLAIWQIYYIYFICVSRCGKMFQIIFVKYTCIIQIYF